MVLLISSICRLAVIPWSTLKSTPLIDTFDGSDRNHIALAISFGVVARVRRLLLFTRRSLNASLKLGVSLVSTEDGLTVLNRIDA